MEQIRISSATYRLKGNESLVEAFGTSNIYLKERGTQPVTIKNGSTTDLTVRPSGAETITGTATLLETGDYVTYSPVYGGYVVTDSGGVNTTETLANKTLTSPIFTNMTHEVTINTHSYASGTTAWTLTAAEQLKPVHKCTLAGGGVDAIIPLTPSIPYTFINASGHAVTVKGASGTSTEIANTKTATVMSDGTNVIRLTLDA